MRDKDLDQILDVGVRAYSAVQPRQGLERRVLEHAHGIKRLEWWRWMAVAIPVLACAVGLLVWRPAQTPHTPSVETSLDAAGTSARATTPAVRPVVVVRRARHVRRLPKRMQFPTPAPLTREERALLEFVQRSPKEAVALLGDTEIKPVQIEAISIPPIKIENLEEK